MRSLGGAEDCPRLEWILFNVHSTSIGKMRLVVKWDSGLRHLAWCRDGEEKANSQSMKML